MNTDVRKVDKSIAEHQIEVHRKFSWAVACMIFLFIGAPMGAIVRKGGFGWPILIAIIFFVFFIMLNIIGEKTAKELILSPQFGMWMPCLVLFPIGVVLTYLAMTDSKIVNIESYLIFFYKLLKLS